MASRGPNPVSAPSSWAPTCEVIAGLLARSARPGGPSVSDTGAALADCIIGPAASAQARALAHDFADPLGFFGNRGPCWGTDTIQRQLPSNPFSKTNAADLGAWLVFEDESGQGL